MKDQNSRNSTADPVIQVSNVFKSFKTVQAVKGVNLKIYPGQFVALLGPNGAGKTTLVEMIEGIQKPDRGEILILGKKWRGHEKALHRVIGLSLQETYFVEKLTVWETLWLFASFYQLDNQRVAEIIDIVDLGAKRKSYVGKLSGGQRQRLALGIALLNHPKILLLDEPTTGLDPNARRDIWKILLELKQKSDTSLILTTHYMEEAEQLCDYIVIIDRGSILAEGTLKQLLENDNTEKTLEFTLVQVPALNNFALQHTNLDIEWQQDSQKGLLVVRQLEPELIEFFNLLREHRLILKNLECKRKTLDDLFTSMTGRHLND